MTGLTSAQEKVSRFVREYINRYGYSPSYEVVGVVMGLLRNYRNRRYLAGRGDSGGNLCSGI